MTELAFASWMWAGLFYLFLYMLIAFGIVGAIVAGWLWLRKGPWV